MAAAAPVFGLRPSDLVAADEFVNYATVEGRKTYAFAIEPLEDKFDGETKNLRLFLKKVGDKARMNGWMTTIMSIPVSTGTPPVEVPRSLISEYGLISLGDIRAHELTYAGQQVRAVQDSANMVEFLNGSLSNDLLLRVIAECFQYTFNGVENGPAMLRMVISLVTIETRATVSLIRARLADLNNKMGEVNSNITRFNEFVKEQVTQLVALGEPIENMVSALFRAYLTVDNKGFNDYITMKENMFNDRTIQELSANELMRMAEEHYKTLKVRDDWTTPETTKAQELVAMKATLAGIVKDLANKRTPGGGAAETRAPKKTFKRYENTGVWAWKDKVPTGDDPKTHKFKGKDYVYCPYHPDTCGWVLAKGHKGGCSNAPSATTPVAKKAIAPNAETTNANKYLKALLGIMKEDEEDEEENEDENV